MLCMLLIAGCGGGENSTAVKSENTAKTSESTKPDSESTTSKDHYLIDVRSQAEWDEGHIETAIHIPHTDIVEGIKKVTSDKSAKIYLH